MNSILKNFSFPYYKPVLILSIIIVLAIHYVKVFWQGYPLVAIISFSLLMTYSFLGNYKSLSKMDELKRLIYLEKGFLLSLFIPLISFAVVLLNEYYKINNGITIAFFSIVILSKIIEYSINKKYK